jgi:hypothetical protein
MWQDFPGSISLNPFHKLLPDMKFVFNLHCEVRSIDYSVLIWRDAVLRAGPKWFGPTSYRISTPEEVRSFFSSLRELNVMFWRRKYDDPTYLDGWSWHVAAIIDERSLDSKGMNAYPPTFLKFCEHVFNFTQLDGLLSAAESAVK